MSPNFYNFITPGDSTESQDSYNDIFERIVIIIRLIHTITMLSQSATDETASEIVTKDKHDIDSE